MVRGLLVYKYDAILFVLCAVPIVTEEHLTLLGRDTLQMYRTALLSLSSPQYYLSASLPSATVSQLAESLSRYAQRTTLVGAHPERACSVDNTEFRISSRLSNPISPPSSPQNDPFRVGFERRQASCNEGGTRPSATLKFYEKAQNSK